MRRRATAQVRNSFPVRCIVAGIHVRTAEIGYLVVLVAGIAKRVHKGGEEAKAAFFVYFADTVRLQKFVDAGAFFVCQVVSGDMLYVKADGLLQITFPAFVRFAGKAVDKVDAYVVEACMAAVLYGIDGLCCIMAAVAVSEWNRRMSVSPY